MKPEPLKDKEGFVDEWQIRDKKDVHPSHLTKVFEEEDIKSAVLWLKEQISIIDHNDETSLTPNLELHFLELIDKAFEDVKDGK
jgi:hypothetical protein